MEIIIVKENEAAILVIDSDINIKTISEFEDKINNLLENGYKNIILSFNNVRYIISSSIGVLIETKKILNNRGGAVMIANMNEYIHWVISSCGGDDAFPSYQSVDEAVESIKKEVK